MAYTLLLIVTDGVINDMQQTKDAIVAAADLPLSIVIVGVGNADFSAMVELDGDDVQLTNSIGKPAGTSIVKSFQLLYHGHFGSLRLRYFFDSAMRIVFMA